MPRKKNVVPQYLLHPASGLARARINGRDVYLGRFDSPESKAKYARLLADNFGEAGRVRQVTSRSEQSTPLTIAELVVQYDDYAKASTSETANGRMNDTKHSWNHSCCCTALSGQISLGR